MLNHRFNHMWSSGQAFMLEQIKDATGLTKSEIVRRMFDHCCSSEQLNRLCPAYSGQIQLGGQK